MFFLPWMLCWALYPTYHPSPKLTVIFLWWTLSPCPPRQPSSGNLTHSKTSLCGPLLLAFLEGTYHIAPGWSLSPWFFHLCLLSAGVILCITKPASSKSRFSSTFANHQQESNYFPATLVGPFNPLSPFLLFSFWVIHQPTVCCEPADPDQAFCQVCSEPCCLAANERLKDHM